ncbi:energy-coupling factor transporter transmembrane protein EcfT [Arcanobacterium phocisimile]|uniref:Energy-coupling factor transporter transmembrane protein EcfT n=1 Tax=Arcanobacterium phocisimile TaxID=1302235 RepID=A0ABX7IGS7_9ACTO|nr:MULTISPECIES: energy-coupling factor transporter transmembrane component T [Arcanobacterium]QRV01664.1 energy-coupling factor transporter transmembrane protein EcfT [Arcanobacterium phocisimile]
MTLNAVNVPDQMCTSWKPIRYFKNDPRTTLLVVLAINITVIGGASAPVLLMATAIVGILFASVGTLKGVIRFVALESGFLLFTYYGASLGTNGFVAFLIGISFWMSRFILTATIGIYAIYSISTSELGAALRALYLPASFVSAVLVMLRFIPTILAEFKAIQEAMKLRGINLVGADVIRHPTQTVQYLIVPLLAGVVRIADDLTASAVIRGLGSNERPLPLYATRFRPADALILFVTMSYVLMRFWNPTGEELLGFAHIPGLIR